MRTALETLPDGGPAPETSAPTTILRWGFGNVPDFSETPAELGRLVRAMLAMHVALNSALTFHLDFPLDLAWLDAVIARREECLAAGVLVWDWFRRNPSKRHAAYRVDGHVLYWPPDARFYYLTDEQGAESCGRCDGLGRFVDRGRAVDCHACNGEPRVVLPWVPAALERMKGGAR